MSTTIEQQIQTAAHRLYDWQHGGTSFTSLLYTLMSKADASNMARLADAFPVEACALISWRNAPSEAEFFKMYGIEGVA